MIHYGAVPFARESWMHRSLTWTLNSFSSKNEIRSTSKMQRICVFLVYSCCLGTAVCSDPVLLVRRVMMYETDVKQARSIFPQRTVLHALWYSTSSVSSACSGVSLVAQGKNKQGCWRQSCLWLPTNLWPRVLLQGTVPQGNATSASAILCD